MEETINHEKLWDIVFHNDNKGFFSFTRDNPLPVEYILYCENFIIRLRDKKFNITDFQRARFSFVHKPHTDNATMLVLEGSVCAITSNEEIEIVFSKIFGSLKKFGPTYYFLEMKIFSLQFLPND